MRPKPTSGTGPLGHNVPFITLTPNLAIDRTLTLGAPLAVSALQRVTEVREAAGGKGVNVARVLATLGARVSVAGFLAGFNGRKFRHLLDEDGLTGVFEEVEGETRECQIVVCGEGQPTEVNELGPHVSPEAWRSLIARLPSGDGWQYVISGSLPLGLSPQAYSELLRELPSRPVVDAAGPSLRAALEAGVALVKPNRAELASVVRVAGDGITEAHELYSTFGVPLLLTLGADGAAYVGEQVHRVAAPQVTAVNPVASGDALLAGFLWARSEGWTLPDALRLGVAAGAENAARGGGARITRPGIMARFDGGGGPGPTGRNSRHE